MTTVQQEPPVTVAGRTLIAITRTKLAAHRQGATCLFVGDKQTIAIICRSADGDAIFDGDGQTIDTDQLRLLLDAV